MTDKYIFSFSEFKKFTSKSYKDFLSRSKIHEGLRKLIINDVKIDINKTLSISEIAKAFNVKDADNANEEVYNIAIKAFDESPDKEKNIELAEYITYLAVTKYFVDCMRGCIGSYEYIETEQENLLIKPAFTSSDPWDTRALVVKDYDQAQLLISWYRDYIKESKGKLVTILDSDEISSSEIVIIEWATS